MLNLQADEQGPAQWDERGRLGDGVRKRGNLALSPQVSQQLGVDHSGATELMSGPLSHDVGFQVGRGPASLHA